MNRTPRRVQIERLRTAALHLVKAHGEWEQVGPARVKGASIEHSQILLTTPFQQFPEASEEVKAFAERRRESDKLDAHYGVDIWMRHKKVMNIHWKEGQPVEVLSFRRGDWESELLDLSSRERC